MSIATILVPLTGAEEVARLLETAIELAANLDAHVTGMAVRRQVLLPVYSMDVMPQAVFDQFEQQEDERLAGLHRQFETAMRTADWKARSDWRVFAGPLAAAIAEAGRYADLILLGQAPEENVTDDVASLAGDLVMAASTPILMVPRIGARPVLAGEALVAWNGGREAARALRDALPLLTRMRKVTLVTVGGDAAETGEPAAAFLARHGLPVTLLREPATDLDPADVMLNLAAERDARLIVIGAYGHSRLREFVLGGTTRMMLHHMTVPLLLSR
ncbi:universal stress protein [Oceanibaculum pacificum]|uniref:UspA domain-containing protein n=1 Tax=Oceanibaculum pacificum TaxID=580166 RepID=A0A154VPX2_9PROT|nr:universal stress protein [Oceanibaculum pacificum]KZD03363.1 hypothetical protein AUP43_13220 [Oceanibaculum pacificum]